MYQTVQGFQKRFLAIGDWIKSYFEQLIGPLREGGVAWARETPTGTPNGIASSLRRETRLQD